MCNNHADWVVKVIDRYTSVDHCGVKKPKHEVTYITRSWLQNASCGAVDKTKSFPRKTQLICTQSGILDHLDHLDHLILIVYSTPPKLSVVRQVVWAAPDLDRGQTNFQENIEFRLTMPAIPKLE
jgi:hypothetical protein